MVCCRYRGREKADGDPLLLAGIKDGAMVQVVETLAYQVTRIFPHMVHRRLWFHGSNQGKARWHASEVHLLSCRTQTCNACVEPCLAATAVLPACGLTHR